MLNIIFRFQELFLGFLAVELHQQEILLSLLIVWIAINPCITYNLKGKSGIPLQFEDFLSFSSSPPNFLNKNSTATTAID